MESVNVKKKTVKRVLDQLNNILLISKDEAVNDKINEVILTINEEVEAKLKEEIVIEDLIYKKMKEIKTRDEGLHFKLYMLYRKLQDGKISEEDAKRTYKSYFGLLQ